MIRQSPERGEPKKRRHQATDRPGRQGREMQDLLAGIFDEVEALDPADFYDPEELGIKTRR